jgi:hypothetical protein
MGWFLDVLAVVAHRNSPAHSPGTLLPEKVPVPEAEYVLLKTGTSDPAAYPKVSTIVTLFVKIAFSAATTASENVVQ